MKACCLFNVHASPRNDASAAQLCPALFTTHTVHTFTWINKRTSQEVQGSSRTTAAAAYYYNLFAGQVPYLTTREQVLNWTRLN